MNCWGWIAGKVCKTGEEKKFAGDLEKFAAKNPGKWHEEKDEQACSNFFIGVSPGDADGEDKEGAVVPSDVVSEEEGAHDADAKGFEKRQLTNQIDAAEGAEGGDGKVPSRMADTDADSAQTTGDEADGLLGNPAQESEIRGRGHQESGCTSGGGGPEGERSESLPASADKKGQRNEKEEIELVGTQREEQSSGNFLAGGDEEYGEQQNEKEDVGVLASDDAKHAGSEEGEGRKQSRRKVESADENHERREVGKETDGGPDPVGGPVWKKSERLESEREHSGTNERRIIPHAERQEELLAVLEEFGATVDRANWQMGNDEKLGKVPAGFGEANGDEEPERREGKKRARRKEEMT